MSKIKLKLMSAGVLVAVAFGVVALRVAWATPSQGVTATLIAGPVALDEIDIKSNTDDHKVKIQTRGEWACRVLHFHVPPGGDFGWHSHPGPKFVMITAGALTKYEADGTSAVFPAGTGFVDAPGDVHTGRNEGADDLELVAFFLTPAGQPIRIDEPAPSGDEDEEEEDDD